MKTRSLLENHLQRYVVEMLAIIDVLHYLFKVTCIYNCLNELWDSLKALK